jgi:hypothetical protein
VAGIRQIARGHCGAKQELARREDGISFLPGIDFAKIALTHESLFV